MSAQRVIGSDLVQRCKAGDGAAFNEVYRTCAKGVFNTILRVVKSKEEAEDLLQETFVSAFGSMDQYRGEASLYGWIKRIGLNKSLNAIKRKQVSFEWEETDVIEEKDEEKVWEKLSLDGPKILDKLNELPEGFRLVLTLYLFENYSHKEIGAELGISEGTSKSQYLRGKRKLKELLLSQ